MNALEIMTRGTHVHEIQEFCPSKCVAWSLPNQSRRGGQAPDPEAEGRAVWPEPDGRAPAVRAVRDVRSGEQQTGFGLEQIGKT